MLLLFWNKIFHVRPNNWIKKPQFKPIWPLVIFCRIFELFRVPGKIQLIENSSVLVARQVKSIGQAL